jgi:hypothetical protein
LSGGSRHVFPTTADLFGPAFAVLRCAGENSESVALIGLTVQVDLDLGLEVEEKGWQLPPLV